MNGDGIRAVAVINDANALRGRPELHARGGRRVAVKGGSDLGEAGAEQVRGRGGKVDVGNDFGRARLHDRSARALRRNAQLQRLTIVTERNGRERKNGMRLTTDAMHGAFDGPGRSVEDWLFCGKEQPAIGRKAAKELHLFLGDGFTAAESGKMSEADVDEDAVVRGGDLLKRVHLAGGGDADLENGQRRRLLG